MQSCGYGTCRYRTNKPEQMQRHRIERGHGNDRPSKKEFRGHRAMQRKKKPKK